METPLRSDAFLTQAMAACGDAVYRLALCRLGSRADAEDVFQEVFLRLLRDTTAFEDEEHLKAWLLRVTANRCSDLRRTAWFRHTAPLEALPDAAAPNARIIPRCGRQWRRCPRGCACGLSALCRGLRHRGNLADHRMPVGNRAHPAAPRTQTTQTNFGGRQR